MENGKRVLFLVRRFYPQIGGVETHVLELSRVLVNKGYSVTVVTESLASDKTDISQNRYISDNSAGIVNYIDKSSKNQLIHEEKNKFLKNEKLNLKDKDIIVLRLPYVKPGRLKKFYIWLWLLKNINFIQNSDIIHCHDVFFWYFPFRFIFFNKPIYSTFHGYESYPIPFKNIVLRKLYEKLLWGNICIGKYLEKWYKTKANHIIYGAVEAKKNIPKLSGKKDNSRGFLNILLIGRLDPDIGIRIYLNTIKLLKERKIPFKFEIIGNGVMYNEVERYGNVHGFVKNVADYIEKADVVFASSYLSIMQALTNLKPVIAVYENKLKEDYLKMTPFSKWVHILNNEKKAIDQISRISGGFSDLENSLIDARSWANEQSWEKVANIYLKLWGLSKKGV